MRVLLALFLLVAPVKTPQFRVITNGKQVKTKNVLQLNGLFSCSDSQFSTSCSCPSTGLLVSGNATFLLTSQARVVFDAPWVTDATGIACGAPGAMPARFSYTLDPGTGFTVLVDTGAPWVGTLQVNCIGASP